MLLVVGILRSKQLQHTNFLHPSLVHRFLTSDNFDGYLAAILVQVARPNDRRKHAPPENRKHLVSTAVQFLTEDHAVVPIWIIPIVLKTFRSLTDWHTQCFRGRLGGHSVFSDSDCFFGFGGIIQVEHIVDLVIIIVNFNFNISFFVQA